MEKLDGKISIVEIDNPDYRNFTAEYDGEILYGRIYMDGSMYIHCDALVVSKFSLTSEEAEELWRLWMTAPVVVPPQDEYHTEEHPVWDFLSACSKYYYSHQSEYHPDGYYSDDENEEEE